MSKKTKVNAAILIIGNEILSGRTQDTNTSTLATWLNSIGVKVNEVRVIPDVEKIIIDTSTPNLDLIPSNIDLVAIEIELVNHTNREFMLKEALESIRNDYDFIIIDCTPSLGLITLNALTAAESVIIPIQCEYFALEGLGKLLNTIKSIQKIHNPDLNIEGLLLTMYDSRLRLSNQVVEEVRKHFHNMVFKTIIQRNVTLGEAPSHGKNIIDYDSTSRGAKNYIKLAHELINKND